MHSELNFVKNSARGNAMYNNRGKNNRIIFEISTLYFVDVEIAFQKHSSDSVNGSNQ